MWLGFLALLTFTVLRIHHWMRQSQMFTLQDVIVSGNRLLSTDEILNLLKVDPDTRLTDLDLRKVQHILEGHPYIETALVSRRFPSTLQIEVVERIPIAYLAGSRLYAVDEQGVLLPFIQSNALGSLPVINGLKDFPERVGEAIPSDRIKQAIELIHAIRIVDMDMYQRLSEVGFNRQKGFVLYFTDSRFPVYMGFNDFLQRVQKAKAFFEQVKKEKRYRKIRYVDVRFDDQVVARFR